VALPTLPKPSVPFFPDPCFSSLVGEIFNADIADTTEVKKQTGIQWQELCKQAAANGFSVK
jgi:hypothetical protein